MHGHTLLPACLCDKYHNTEHDTLHTVGPQCNLVAFMQEHANESLQKIAEKHMLHRSVRV